MTKQNQPPAGFAVISEPKPFRIEEGEGFARLYLHGFFDHVEENTKLVTDLHALSEKYNILEVWISSDGGVVTLLNELMEALKLYQTVVTICNSSASSAGAMIWGLGHVRVVSEFAQLMWHRESYGFYGKTNQHEDHLEHQKKVFPIFMKHCVGDILTEDEIEKAKYTEVHKTGQELIEAGHAMSFEEYKTRMKESMTGRFTDIGTVFYDNLRGCMVLSDDDGFVRTIGTIHTSPYKYSFFDIGMSKTIRMMVDDEENGTINQVEMTEEEFNDVDCKYLEIFDEKDDEDDPYEESSEEFGFVLDTSEETEEVESDENTTTTEDEEE